MFETCLIDGRTRKQICDLFPARNGGAYYLDKFCNHLKYNHQTSLISYCERYFNFSWPTCPVKKTKLGYCISGKGVKISEYSLGSVNKKNCAKFSDGCKRLSEERKGRGNPMYKKTLWNKGKNYEIPSRQGKPLSEMHRASLKEARAKSPYKARHTTPHSEQTKKILAIRQAEKYAAGIFKRRTGIEIKVEQFLSTLKLKESYIEQHQVKYFTLDFALQNGKVGIECQGSFFHIDPRVYPNGPICAVQRRNFGRDKAKRKYLAKRGWTIIELWETEINSGEFKEILLCKLSELNLLED